MVTFPWDAPGCAPRASALARDWLSWQADRLAPNTVSVYGYGLSHFYRFCAQNRLDPIEAGIETIAKYLHALRAHRFIVRGAPRQRKSGLSNASIRHRLTIVRIFYDYLCARGTRRTNPVMRGRTALPWAPQAKRGLLPVLHTLPWLPTADEWAEILTVMQTETLRNKLMFALAYDCALRRQELCLLETGDLDPGRRLLTVRPDTTKGYRGRVVPYSSVSAELLAAYLQERRQLDPRRGRLFLSVSSRNRGAPLKKWGWSKVVRRVGLAAAIPQLRTHSFRHLCLTELARAGWDIREIADFAGHRTLEATKRYIQLSGREVFEKYQASMADLHERRLRLLDENRR